MKRRNLTAVLAAFLLLFLPSHHVMATFLFTYDAAGRLEYTTQGQSFVHDASGNLLYAFHSAAFPQSDQVVLSNLPINPSAGAKHTVEFWMYWDGTNSVMPFAWDTNYSLWMADGYFGFNTGESNIIGISSEGLKNRWVQVSAIFYNGIPNAVDNELYIDGVKQAIGPVMGATAFHVGVTPEAHISGDKTSHYRMSGRIGEVRIWNYPLTESEIQTGLHRLLTGTEAGLIGYWKSTDSPQSSQSLSFPQSDQVVLSNLSINPAAGAKHTVEFWMYWDGTNSVMPFAWDTNYSLWLADGYFGFNTGESNILGISSTGLANRWVHVAAVFYNGVPNPVDNELYIDGVKQTIGTMMGTTSFSVGVTSGAYISGDSSPYYRMGGRIGEVRIWNAALTEAEVRAGLYKAFTGSEAGLIGFWKLSEKPRPSSALTFFPQSEQVVINHLAVNPSPGAKHTVEFWMYWDGTNSVMPFTWNTNYNLWLADGYFGFNTGESNILGISSEGLENRWVHVGAVFYNGVPNAAENELYIDGVKQTIAPVKGTTSFVVGVTPRAQLSGDAISNHRMGGRIGEVRIWNYPLTEAEMRAGLHKVVTGSENGLIGYWKLDEMPRPSKAMSFPQSDQVRVSNLAVNPSPGAKHTVEFWMYWDGTNSVMPFAWNTNYSLWLADGYFGFNTGEGNILGISSDELKNRWVHVGAVFYNGVPNAADNELYIDGVKQTIGPVKGTTSFAVGATSEAYISGDWSSYYRMSGRIGEVRIWNYPLTETEFRSGLFKRFTGNEAGLIGYWKLDEWPQPGKFLSFPQSNQVGISNLAVDPTPGAKHTVEFWMYWDGTNSVMPFAWNTNYSLWLADGYFGFNTGESNILGIPSAGLKNRWVHVAAVFYNGVPNAADNELYIDGVKQTIAPVMGTTSFAVAVTSEAYVSGDWTAYYRMSGRIGEVRIWNYPLSAAELRAGWYKVLAGSEAGLIGFWEPY